MYASVITGQIQLGKFDEFLQLWQDKLAPALKQLKGFKGAFVLTDRETNSVQAITLYETRDQAHAVQASGRFQELAAMLGQTIVRDSGVRMVYDVSIQVMNPS